MTPTVTTRAELAAAYAALRPGTARGVVLTMGALHAGHAALVDAVRTALGPAGHLTVTVFVNPLQFGPAEDLARYPRSLDADAALVGRHGADLVFAPPVDVVYPDGDPLVTVDPGPLADRWEGAARPGHFGGVLTVVHKLFSLTGAGVTAFGEKDYQQLVLVRRMVRDLDLPIRVLAVPTAREPDGLARSSRNAYLDPGARTAALVVPSAVRAGVAAASEGPDAVRDAACGVLAQAGAVVDYVAVTDPELGPPPATGPGRLLLAVRIGGVRLLDNAALDLGGA